MRTFSFLFAFFLCALPWAIAEATKAKKQCDSIHLKTVSSGGGFESDGEDAYPSDFLIQENPDYVPVEEDSLESDSDSDDDGSDTDSDDNEDDDDVKKKMSKKLKKKRQKTQSKPLELLSKNKFKITMALALYAFRKEIFMLLLKLPGPFSSKDPTTDVLKLLLFVSFMRKSMNRGIDDLGILGTIGSIVDSNPAFVPPIIQHFAFESLNEYYLKDGMALQKSMRARNKGLKWTSSSTSSIRSQFASFERGSRRKKAVPESTPEEIVVVLDWTKLDQGISSLNELRQEVSFLLSEYRSLVMKGEANTSDNYALISPTLEVIVLLESPGGAVSEYGLAAQYLLRLRNEPGITLSICVDKVAASGGYMLCCTATPGKLFAAPFAVLGSIGVISQVTNLNKLATDWGIKQIQFKGGKNKAPIGPLTPISKDGKRASQSIVDDVHQAFKDHVANARPILKNKIEKIGDGSIWMGVDAVDLGLIDSIKISDEYIEEMIRGGARVFKMVQVPRSGLLFGHRCGSLGSLDSKRSSSVEASTTTQKFVEGFIEKSKTMLMHFPVQINCLFSKFLV